jgi:alpha-glucosidase (family GH31 glycosyl hydrolase)
VHFIDFFHVNASRYWKDMLSHFRQQVNISGVWLDMNEYANFCNGPCVNYSTPSTFDYSKDLPWNPNGDKETV